MTRKINLIVIHCSATRSNQRFTVEMLKACHNARFHGKGIGYHYYIEKDGQVFQTRDENEIGMHARHYNAHSIGICYEGGLDEKGQTADTRTPAQRAALIALLRSLKIDSWATVNSKASTKPVLASPVRNIAITSSTKICSNQKASLFFPRVRLLFLKKL